MGEIREIAKSVDAKGLVEWVELMLGGPEEVQSKLTRSDRWARRWYAWRFESERVCIYTADEFLIHIGLHLSELPDELLRVGKKARRQRNTTAQERAEALAQMEQGATPREIAKQYEISVDAVKKWRTQANRKAVAA